MKSMVIALVAVFLVIGGFRFLFNHVMSAATEDNSTCLVLEGSTTTEDNHVTYIIGTVRNGCSRRFLNVNISFKLNPQPNGMVQAGYVTAHASNLEPGQSLEFKTTGFTNNNGYQLDKLSGF